MNSRIIKNYFCNLTSEGANLTKVVATFCVVLVHSNNIFEFAKMGGVNVEYLKGFRVFASVGVPLFFVLSGYFLLVRGTFNWKRNVIKKISSLLVPYAVFMILYTILNCVGYLVFPSMFDNFFNFRIVDWIDHLIGCPFFSNPKYYEPFWFLRDLFLLNILTVFLVPLIKKVSCYVIIPAMIILWLSPLPHHFRQSFSFFIIGMCLGKEKSFPTIKNVCVSGGLFVFLFIIASLSDIDFILDISTFMMAFALLSILNYYSTFGKIKQITELLIPYSFITYALHQHPLTLIQKMVVMKINPSIEETILLYFLLPFFVIGLCIVFALFIKRIAPSIYRICVGNRYTS